MRVLTVKPFLIRAIATLAGFAIMATVGAQTINAPIVVPLHLTLIDTGTYKLGIYATIGDGATPALFEFDTGATGFYATYSPNQNVSPWWGSGVNSLQMPVDASYASGLHYTGNPRRSSRDLVWLKRSFVCAGRIPCDRQDRSDGFDRR